MLELRNIGLTMKDANDQPKEILKNINLKLEPGKLYGVTGPNGGGKTSLSKVIMGIYHQTTGEIFFDGQNISDLAVDERARLGISYAFQQPPRFKGLTVEDILNIAAGKPDSREIRTKLREVGLCPEDYLERNLGAELSGGEIKRIEMAQILLRNSRVNIFDEPESGVDLWTVQRLANLLMRGYRNHPNKITLLISHNEKMLPICDEIIVINQGTIEKQGTAQEIWHGMREDLLCRNREQCQGEMIHEFNQN